MTPQEVRMKEISRSGEDAVQQGKQERAFFFFFFKFPKQQTHDFCLEDHKTNEVPQTCTESTQTTSRDPDIIEALWVLTWASKQSPSKTIATTKINL